MPNLTDIPSNVAVGFVTTQGSDYYYGDLEVRRYLETQPSGLNIYTDSEGVLHFDPANPPSAPTAITRQRVVMEPQSLGLNQSAPAAITLLT